MTARASRSIQIDYGGQNYSGPYDVLDGVVTVSSPYGSESSAARPYRNKAVAEGMLLKIVRDYMRAAGS